MVNTKIIKVPIGNTLIIPGTASEDLTGCTLSSVLKNRSGLGRIVGTFSILLGTPISGEIKTFTMTLAVNITALLEIGEIHGFDIKFVYPDGRIHNSPIVLIQFEERVTS
jgi:hypothetical protein